MSESSTRLPVILNLVMVDHHHTNLLHKEPIPHKEPMLLPPPQGYSPYGYPPHMYPGAYGQAAPPPYYGGYPGYPSQQARPPDKPLEKPSRRKSPTRRQKSPRRSQGPPKSPEDAELERQRAAADVMSKVKPMRSAFHFFVDDMEENLRQVAEEEVRRSTGAEEEEVDLYLLNTNLNSRLMKEWENADQDIRDVYITKEDEDRKRFMADDEVASRHCATLTARARSPRFGTSRSKGTKSDDEGDDERSFESVGSYGNIKQEEDEKKRASPTENDESPPKKSRTDEEAADE